MRIAIIGTGAMASALGAGWVAAGHDVAVFGRSADRSAQLADAIGARSGSVRQAVSHGDVLLLAVHHRGIDDTLAQLDLPSLAGKVLIDCMNSVETNGLTLELPPRASSIAEYLADRTTARVVKAFNMAEAAVWAGSPPGANPRMALRTVLTAAADAEAAEIVAGLARDLGFRAVNVGGLERSSYLEAAAAVVITLLGSGEPSGSMLTWLRPTEVVVAA